MSDPCEKCGSESAPKIKVCDVCRIIDNDQTEKLCVWCQFCKAWICKADETNWKRRGIAFAKTRFAF